MSAPCEGCGVSDDGGSRLTKATDGLTLNCGTCGMPIMAFYEGGRVAMLPPNADGMSPFVSFFSGYLAGAFVKWRMQA